MQLHENCVCACPRRTPFRPQRIDAWKYRHLDVSIRDAGLLVTFGAIVLCIGSPLTAWLTSRIESRALALIVVILTRPRQAAAWST